MQSFSLGHILRRAGMPAAAAAAAVLLVGGCGGGGGEAMAGHDSGSTMSATSPSATGIVLDITGTEYAFGSSPLRASSGMTTIRFTNKGAMEHDFAIEALGVHLNAQPGRTAEATVTLKPGTYESTCTIPGHAQSGMRGTLTVS